MPHFARLSANHATVKTTRLPQLLDVLAELGIESVGLWRESVEELGVDAVMRGLRNSGVRVSSYTTGGFVVAPTPGDRASAVEDVRRSLDDAAALGAHTVVIRAGGLPEHSKDLESASRGVAATIAAIEPFSVSTGVSLALEPLHPMFTGDRGVVVTIDHALEIVEPFDARFIGVALDVYNSWWDPNLIAAIERSANRIKVVQVADWVMPRTANLVHSRAMIGDGSIDYEPIFAALKAGNFFGDIEAEIFNDELWKIDPRRVMTLVKERFRTYISPLL